MNEMPSILVGGRMMNAVVSEFGPFRLDGRRRVLEKNRIPVTLGSRPMDLLMALIDTAPQIVSKRELLARVWPGMVVEEGNLRFQVGVLRRALGDGQAGRRYIVNVAGRGYCFVAPVLRVGEQSAASEGGCGSSPPLPVNLGEILGREQTLADIESMLAVKRFVSIVGGGGVGKTTVAVAVAHVLLAQFENGVRFLDLSSITNPALVAETIAATVRLPRGGSSAMPAPLARTHGQRVLLVLDNCEHVIEAVASAVQNILREDPQVHILATSREPLRVHGEQVYRLGPLGCPPEPHELTSATALQFPAVQLFLRSVAASGHSAELTDADACTVGEICHRLDGIPLALELAAGRVGAYGMKGVLVQLDGPRWLHWRGWRTAPARQLTFGASLEWSYKLLSESERTALHRLARMDGTRPIEPSRLAAREAIDSALRAEALASLVDKSLVATHASGSARCYRVLDTTRAFLEQTPKTYQVGPVTAPSGTALAPRRDRATRPRFASRPLPQGAIGLPARA
jgi:predicted ATPase/DNA-binding winged helix-turn-helix (wHTH) protein